MAENDDRQPDEKSRLENLVEGEGDAIDRSTLPEGMRGEAPEPEQRPQPERDDTVEITVDGQSFRVPRDLADAYYRQSDSYRRERHEPEPEPARPPADETDWDALWFSDPKAVRAKLAEEIKSEVRQEYQQERQREQFWNEFYDENPTLRKYRTVVNTVLQEEYAQLQHLPTGKRTRDKLAELSKDRLLSIGRDFAPRAVEDTNLETGSGPSPQIQQRPEQRPQGSMTSYLRERRAARMGQPRSEG